MLRRPAFSLPYPELVPALTAAVRGEPTSAGRDDRFAEAALHHQVAGFVLTAADEGRLQLQPRARTLLADRLAVATLRSGLLRHELATVTGTLDAAGAPPILLKGPAVADRFYSDRALRPFADLDLLVPRDRLGTCVEALAAAGYAPLEQFRAGFAEIHGHDVHLVRPIGRTRVDVELHWRAGDDPATEALGYEVLTATAQRLEVAGAVVIAAAPAEQLLVLAIHLLSDRAKRLIWVLDLALAARAASDEEWERAFRLADETRLDWVLHRALDYPARLLELDRPRPSPPPGQPPPWGPLRAVETLDMRASTHIGRLALLGWPDRFRYLRTVLIPSRAGLEGSVGGDEAPLWKLVARHVARVFKGLARRRS